MTSQMEQSEQSEQLESRVTPAFTSHEDLSDFDMETPPPVLAGSLATDVLGRFRSDEKIMALPVVDRQGRPVGLINRRTVLTIFGYRYSYELHSRKHTEILMSDNPLIFDAAADIDTMSRAMTDRNSIYAFDPAVMTHGGIYCGLLSVITLLKQLTDIRIQLAFDSNPLSRLPGNNSINRELNDRLQQGIPFVLIYVDLDSFKAFNDHYGYERGDRVIQLVADILKTTILPLDFIGHVGGDDFVMILTPADWRIKAETVLNRFRIASRLMYDAEARERGFIAAENRQGEQMHFPLMTLSLAVVPCAAGSYDSHIEVSEVASEVKHLAKQELGNSIVVNRRETEENQAS